MLALWGKGGYGGSPNVEAGKMYRHSTLIYNIIPYMGLGLEPYMGLGFRKVKIEN